MKDGKQKEAKFNSVVNCSNLLFFLEMTCNDVLLIGNETKATCRKEIHFIKCTASFNLFRVTVTRRPGFKFQKTDEAFFIRNDTHLHRNEIQFNSGRFNVSNSQS